MSTLNMHPPQTYSRLFRPWDCNSSASSSPINQTVTNEQHQVAIPLVKSEYSSSSEDMSASSTSMVKTENCSFSGNESDRECASSSSSSSKSCSYEDSFSNSMQMDSTTSTSPTMTNALVHPVPYTNSHLYGSLDSHANHLAAHHQHPAHASAMTHMMPPMPAASASDFYYAAAAAAAANGLPPVPTTSAAAAYALDPYALSLMEQEYARVMAEDAHLKAVNARKQRPKKFKCPHCDVAFSNNGQLKGHIRIHTGERPFKCDVETCGKTFTRNEELTRHKRIHTGLRPYPCTACGKKFGRRDHLKKHMKTHMPQERQLGPAIFVPMYPYLYGY
ncbi:zinc finger and SCAN domain-containing protein 10 [Calliphora vicina]|uniref:zinc finger and SCAN domain-containing protein 10 n=1 Tax=Calliphora vicina TaxID=7373 RepID=UPI00325B3A7B